MWAVVVETIEGGTPTACGRPGWCSLAEAEGSVSGIVPTGSTTVIAAAVSTAGVAAVVRLDGLQVVAADVAEAADAFLTGEGSCSPLGEVGGIAAVAVVGSGKEGRSVAPRVAPIPLSLCCSPCGTAGFGGLTLELLRPVPPMFRTGECSDEEPSKCETNSVVSMAEACGGG